MTDRIVSANAYLGAAPIVDALAAGADIVLTGRVADPSLFTSRHLIHEFGWSMDDWQHARSRRRVVGHLLECAGQVTGGYFADPGFKDVPKLARLGFPIGEVAGDGSRDRDESRACGRARDRRRPARSNCSTRFMTRLVICNPMSSLISPCSRDRGSAGSRPCERRARHPVHRYAEGLGGVCRWLYRGRADIVWRSGRARERPARTRYRQGAVSNSRASTRAKLRFDLIGVNALHGDTSGAAAREPYEVRARVAGRTTSAVEAVRIGNEVETLYTNGPAGGGGVTRLTREVLAVQSVLLPRVHVNPSFQFVEA